MADFKLGRIKFKWRGDWATSTAYVVDDIVKYGGNSYTVVTNHTSQSSSANFYTDIAKYSLHTEGLFFKGDWAGSTHYKLNDLVKYGAFQYRTTTQHTSHASNFDPSKFEVYGEGFQFEDSYNASTVYQDGDVVTYGGYSYVYINTTPASGQTPTDNTYWDVLTTGFKALGAYSHGTTYKTGDTIQYGGNNYVCIANHTNQYPANTNGTTNTSYWQLNLEGFNYRAAYNASTTYNIGDVVRLTSTTYVAIQDRVLNVSPDSDGAKWQIVAQGDSGAVLSTRGDLIRQGSAATERLPVGVSGTVLTTDGTDALWSTPQGKNVLYVSNAGNDSNPGSQYQPYKTIKYALTQSGSGDIVNVDTIAGGTGGTPAVYNNVTQLSSNGPGTGSKFRVTTDGSSTPTIEIIDGGKGHVEGNTITLNGSDVGGASNITFNATSVSSGDVIYVQNGIYKESMPMVVPAGVTLRGESLRGTEVRPASGVGTQIKTVSITTNTSGATNGTYNYIHASATSGNGTAATAVFNITIASGAVNAVTVYHGGYGFAANDTVTIPAASIGNGGNLVLTVSAVENNNASKALLLNNSTNVTQFTFKGMTGTPGAGGIQAAAITSLDPSGSITTASPYIQNCTSTNAGATGIEIDGNLHSAGNKSILANDFTQINSDGIGCHAIAGGRGEMVSIFTYYCAKSFYAHSGGFIRGLNCSSAYGEKGAVSEGTLASENAVSAAVRGKLLKYSATEFVGSATESDVENCITTQGQGTATIAGAGGASARIFRTNISTDVFHIENISGSFVNGEVLTITKEDSTTFQVKAAASAAETGISGALIPLDGAALSNVTIIKPGANIVFTGNSNYYRVSAVTETNGSYGGTGIATVRLTSNITSGDAIADNTVTTITTGFSNVRLTGHDFLDIGTGDIVTSNYPGGPSQAADQEDEIDEVTGGRVYFTSTDQQGDFRVGDLFRIQQATGIATLNADAFDLSGLNQLQLGSIGAELGSTINEFSTDETLGGDANTAVPTERAIVGYTQRDQMGTGHLVPPTGTTAERPSGGALKTGGIRYNSSLVTWEGYNGTQWTGLGGGNPWQTHTADGSTALAVAANDRYFINTSAGAQTANLPASPQVGDQVRFIDLASTFDTNNLTVGRNGKKINNATADLVVSTEDSAIGLVFTGDTFGWKLIEVL